MSVDRSRVPVVSVVMPAYRSRDTIEECLGALTNQVTDLPYEVIVVESSGDGSAEIVRERFPSVRLIEPGRRTFAGEARNLGAEGATGELLAFVDSDCRTEPGWLDKMWNAHRSHDCVAVAGSILNANPETSVSISSYINEHSDFYPIGSPRYLEYLCSGNVSYKADVFRKYGGYYSTEPLYEDVMFNKRLSMAGEKLLFVPDIRVWHHHRTELREYLAHEYRRGKGAAAARRRGLMAGAALAKYPALAFLAAPALFLRKATVYPLRMAKAYPGEMGRLTRALPCLWVALTFWHAGFLSEVVSPRSVTDGERTSACKTS